MAKRSRRGWRRDQRSKSNQPWEKAYRNSKRRRKTKKIWIQSYRKKSPGKKTYSVKGHWRKK